MSSVEEAQSDNHPKRCDGVVVGMIVRGDAVPIGKSKSKSWPGYTSRLAGDRTPVFHPARRPKVGKSIERL